MIILLCEDLNEWHSVSNFLRTLSLNANDNFCLCSNVHDLFSLYNWIKIGVEIFLIYQINSNDSSLFEYYCFKISEDTERKIVICL